MRQLADFLLISVLLRCRHGILDKARLASKELMEHCTQSRREVALQISLLNSSLQLLEELCPSIGSCAHGLPLQPLIFFCASLCLFTSCKTFRVNVKTA